MARALSENPENADFGTGVGVPENGDSGTTWWGLLIAAIQQLADRSQALAAVAPPGTLTIRLQLDAPVPGGADDWVFGVNGNVSGSTAGLSWGQAEVGAASELYFPMALPPGRTIVSYRARVRGNLGNMASVLHAGLPGTMPIVDLIRSKYDGAAINVVDTVTDTSASAAAYDAAHDIAKTLSSPHTPSADYSYYLRIKGETGANSQANCLGIFMLEVTFGAAA